MLCGVLTGCGDDGRIEDNGAADAALQARLADNSGRVMVLSYNTAAPWGSFWDGTSSNKRAPLFAEQILSIAPDSMGVQELNSNWAKKMEELLPAYAYYGVQRGGDGQ